MCAEHAVGGMANVVTLRCGHPNCSKRPSYGMAGSMKAEMCAEHALDGMVDVVSKRCGHPNPKRPSYGMAGSKKPNMCAEHAPWMTWSTWSTRAAATPTVPRSHSCAALIALVGKATAKQTVGYFCSSRTRDGRL